jgi:hypothetical protein
MLEAPNIPIIKETGSLRLKVNYLVAGLITIYNPITGTLPN